MRGRSSHVQKFRKADMKKMFGNTGFKIEESEEIKGFFFVDFPIMDKIPFSNVFKMFGRKIGRYMSVACEFKVSKVIEGET